MNKFVDLSVSLISHNSRKDLERLLPSLLLALRSISSEILLVDNNSDDDTVAFIKKNYPQIRLRKNRLRQGYGANHNQNLAVAKGRYIVLMNADMIVDPACFQILLEYMKQHPAIGIMTAKILNEDGSLQFLNKRYPTCLDLFIRRFFPHALQQMFKKRLDYYEMRDIGYDRIVDVPFVSGAFMLARTALIQKLKGFDERFFMYFEDVDLCRRVQRTHRTVYHPDARIIHRWERAAHKELKWAVVFMTSAFRYFNKWGYRLF